LLARDRFGIKPLYYAVTGGTLSFGSELKALLRQPGFPTEIDIDAVEAFLAFNSVPAPYTIFEAARKLPPGHRMIWSGGEPRIERFARPAPPPATEVRTASADVLADVARERLRDSVRAHLVADVPVGLLLSGGIDSCTLAALAAEASGEPLRTFSIGFDERSFDELERARIVARRPSSSRRRSLDYMARRLARGARLPPLDRHHAWEGIFGEDARLELLGERADRSRDPLELWRARYAETEGAEELARLQDVDVGIYLADDLLTKTDRASMAHSLEVRVPFLDTQVTDLALALPRRMKIRGFSKKRLLRRAVEPLLPRSILHGRKR